MADEHEDDTDSELLLDDPLDDAEDEAPPEGAEDKAPADDEGDDDDVEYVIGDELAPASGRGENSDLVKHLRKELKEATRRAAEAERLVPKPKIEVGDKPKFDDYWDEPEKFEADLISWTERKRAADDQQVEQRKAQEQVEEEGKRVVQGYEDQKRKLARPDYDDAEANVFGKLKGEKVATLLQGSDNAAQIIHALHRFPEKLDELAKITNPAKFAFAAAKLEGQLKVMPKRKAPQPEEIARGNASVSGGDKTLQRLEAAADKSGDRSELAAYRLKLREKAK